MHIRKVVWVEGPDNVGKSTLISQIRESLINENDQVVEVVSQPRSSNLGEVIYDLHHKYQDLKMNMFSRQLLHVAAHIEYYKCNANDRKPKILLNDRSFLSTIAYYKAFETLNEEQIKQNVDLILDLEYKNLPQNLHPTEIIFLLNQPFVVSNEELENYEKLSVVYKELIWLAKELFPRTKIYGHRLEKGQLNKSVSELKSLIIA